ncbi:RNA polymerase sigma factor [Kitasatospora phosalacinea]|uniref:RNA polymerase sigma factor n=1 Tax=Kitasatospora phosalacinea TaxID=2065 RepID=UPI000ABECBFF|nr:RNA polymerase sigma factor [Kitasatospora phosalacinea]
MRGEFLALLDEAHPRLVRLLMLRGVNRQDAEDAVQEAVLQAWHQVLAGRWETIGNQFGWLRRVTWNVHMRPPGRKRVQPLTVPVAEPPETPSPAPDHADLTAQTLTVLNALAALPEPQRAVLALTLDEATESEIADLLKVTTQKVRDLRKQGRTALRRELARDLTAKEGTR